MKKTEKKYFIAEHYKTEEERESRKKEIDKQMQSVLKTIKAGKVYAKIESVSQSGMSRRISFYRVSHGEIDRITSEIAWLSDEVVAGKYEQGSKYLLDYGLSISGCGMDMIFATLYNCMPYEQAKNWNQNYKAL